jgi:hypothetical protein
MSQQTQEQKDADALAKNDQAYGTGQKKVETAGFKTHDASYRAPQENLDRKVAPVQPYDTKVTQPASGQTTTQNDNPAAKEAAAPANEKGMVDAPTRMNATGVQTDAKRDATPIQKPSLVNEDQTNDTE